jgi:acetyl esterase/lipase
MRPSLKLFVTAGANVRSRALAGLLFGIGLFCAPEVAAQSTLAVAPDLTAAFSQETYVYKQVGDCAIKATVSRANGTEIRPAIIWIHGGSLLMGNRNAASSDQLQRYVRAGFVVIAIDYRLAPETKLPAILEDVRDAYRWAREKGPQLFSIDPNRMALVGHSSGADLALAVGAAIEPRPRAIVSFYGCGGDLLGDWATQPDVHSRELHPVSKEEAYQAVGRTILSESPVPTPRQKFSRYCSQNGLWVKAVTGLDPVTDRAALEALCPMRHVTAEFPPTLFLCGDKDTGGPLQQTGLMADALQAQRVTQRFIRMEGYGHLFDMPSGARPLVNDPKVAAAYDRVVEFLQEYLGR